VGQHNSGVSPLRWTAQTGCITVTGLFDNLKHLTLLLCKSIYNCCVLIIELVVFQSVMLGFRFGCDGGLLCQCTCVECDDVVDGHVVKLVLVKLLFCHLCDVSHFDIYIVKSLLLLKHTLIYDTHKIMYRKENMFLQKQTVRYLNTK